MKKSLVAGLVAAVAMVSVAATVGFQNSQPKFGTVDMDRVMNGSTAGTRANEQLQTELRKRQGLIEFAVTNPVMTQDQATQLKDLTLKPSPAAADTTALNTLKQTIQAQVKEFDALNKNANPSEADRTKLAEYNANIQQMNLVLTEWDRTFSNELSTMREDSRQSVLDTARAAVKSVGQREGYTVVFESNVAIYGSNDLSDAVIKAMDAAR